MNPLPDLAVRELHTSDLDAYKSLRDHALAHNEEAFTSDAAAEAQRTARSYAARLGNDDTRAFTLGAFRGDRLVGAVTCNHDARIKVQHIGHVTGMMVHADEQGRGVGAVVDRPLAGIVHQMREDVGHAGRARPDHQ